jgi:hypothetical protein
MLLLRDDPALLSWLLTCDILARDDASCCLKDVRFTAAYSGGGQAAHISGPVARTYAGALRVQDIRST